MPKLLIYWHLSRTEKLTVPKHSTNVLYAYPFVQSVLARFWNRGYLFLSNFAYLFILKNQRTNLMKINYFQHSPYKQTPYLFGDWLGTEKTYFQFTKSDRKAAISVELFSPARDQHAPASAKSGGRKTSLQNCRAGFFKVQIRQGVGPIHLLRTIVSYWIYGKELDPLSIIVYLDLLERCLDKAERDTQFRRKWNNHCPRNSRERDIISPLVTLAREVLPKVITPRGTGYLVNLTFKQFAIKVRFNLQMNCNLDRLLIPPKKLNKDLLDSYGVRALSAYQLSKEGSKPKRKGKVSPAKIGKGSMPEPGAIKWQEVANSSRIYISGKGFIDPTTGKVLVSIEELCGGTQNEDS